MNLWIIAFVGALLVYCIYLVLADSDDFGWKRLSKVYPGAEFTGELRKEQSVTISDDLTSYNNCVGIGVDKGGLYMQIAGTWDMKDQGRPPLFIPWGSIKRSYRREGVMSDFCVIELKEPEVSIELPFEAIEPAKVYLSGGSA